MKILLTAFDPFGEDEVNPAQEALKLLPNRTVSPHKGVTIDIVKLTVPTVFHKSVAVVLTAIQSEKPNAVLCIGQAGGRFELTPERVAINMDDARIKDNDGNQPIDEPIYADGASAYFSTLPIKRMVQAIRDAGLPASVSNSAGTFVCNHLMYGVLYHLHKDFPRIRGGFMHVPFIPSQVVHRQTPAPCMNLQDIANGIIAAICAVAENETDLHTAEGKTH